MPTKRFWDNVPSIGPVTLGPAYPAGTNHERPKEIPMKFKQFLALTANLDGFFPTSRLRWVIRKNPRSTAREEAIAAKVLEAANPRENITGHFPWGPEEQPVLQQLWIHPDNELAKWRDVPTEGAEDLYSVEQTESGELPVPNIIKEPGTIRADFKQRLEELLGGDCGEPE